MVVPKPLKPKFRYPKPRPHLTTVIAVQCKDGVILCADGQESNEYTEFGTKQLVGKIDQLIFDNKLDEQCLIGCAGVTTYTDQLRERIGEAIARRNGKSYHEALESATRSYSRFVNARKSDTGLEFDPTWASGVFAGYEGKRSCVYTLLPPHPPELLYKYPYRTGVGTGWIFASFLFVVAEEFMRKLEITWPTLSTVLVAQFCYMVLGRVFNYEGASGMGISIYRLNDKTGSWEGLSDDQIFPRHGEKGLEYRSTIFMDTLLKELPPEKLVTVVEKYHLLDVMMSTWRKLKSTESSSV